MLGEGGVGVGELDERVRSGERGVGGRYAEHRRKLHEEHHLRLCAAKSHEVRAKVVSEDHPLRVVVGLVWVLRGKNWQLGRRVETFLHEGVIRESRARWR